MTDACESGPVDAALVRRIERFVTARFGAGTAVTDVRLMIGGHAGLTFGFRAVGADGGERADLILKLAPRGVRRQGNTDVYRQAPLLRALHRLGLPVPAVPFASPDEDEFGVPYIMMERLPGREFFVWDPHPSFARDPATVGGLWCQMAEVLPRLHRLEWTRELGDWELPRALATEINRWPPIYAKAPDPAWIRAADGVRELLLASVPQAAPVGLIHGDFQPGNALFEDGRLTGIIDWELSWIGSRLLDIGWMMMIADPASWCAEYRAIHPPAPAELREIYERGMGRSYADIPWHQALANYQLGAITSLNLMLHRSGRREDPYWERMGTCAPYMFERARELLAGAAR